MKNIINKTSSNIYWFLLMILFIFIINLSLLNCDCQVDTPILKNSICQLIYCSEEDFKNGICLIKNEIIETQWLNNIILFKDQKFRFCNFAINSKGDLIEELSPEEANGIRLFYGLKKDGTFYFNNSYICTKILSNENEHPVRYESENIFVSLNDTNKNNDYLISISLYLGGTELFDFEENIESFISTCDFTGYNIYSTRNQIIELINDNNEKEYLHMFVGREKNNNNFNNFFIVLHKYSFYKNIINNNDGYSISKSEIISNVYSSRAISGYKTDPNLIIIFYYHNQFRIAVYDIDLNKKTDSKLSSGNFDGSTGAFFKCIYLKSNLGAFIYYKNQNDYFPHMIIGELNNNYNIEKKINVLINMNEYRFNTEPLLNDLIKMNDNRFCLISSSYDKEKLYIILSDLYNNDENLKIRFYNIYLLRLYNFRIYREISSIIYNDYLLVSLSVCDSLPCNYNDGNTNYFSTLIFFNYINGTDSFIDFSPFLIENKEDNENTANLISTLLENIKIDNNIFGYELLKEIKLISFPNEIMFYNIGTNGEISQLNQKEILKINHKIEQKLMITKNLDNIYYIEYQYIIKEPSYNKFNEFPVIIKDYPENSTQTQEEEFLQNVFYSRINKLKFRLCNEHCKTCVYLGTQRNNKCLTCIDSSEIDESGNCFNYSVSVDSFIEEEEENDGYPNEENDYTEEVNNDYIEEENISLYEEEENDDYIEEEEKFSKEETEELDKNPSQSITIIIEDDTCLDYSKFYIDINSKEKICIKDEENCPLNYPFFNETSKECMETISFDNLLKINLTQYNSSEENEILYNLFKTSIISNYKGNENLVISTQDSNIFQLTNTLNELNAINSNNNLSKIDLGECGKLLEETYGIDDNTPLIIFKLEKSGEIASKRNIQFEIYNPLTKEKMNLSICDDEKINLYIPVNISEETKELSQDLLNYGYDLFNPNDSFYQDICSPYTSAYGTDVLLSDRRNYFFNNTETSCQEGCDYSDYSFDTGHLKCECSVTDKNIQVNNKDTKFSDEMILYSFLDVIKYSNYKVLKCYKLIFDLKKLKYNYGSYFFIIYFIFFTLFNIIFFVKGIDNIKIYASKIINNYKGTKESNKNLKKDRKSRVSIFAPKSIYTMNMPPRKSLIIGENSKNYSKNFLNKDISINNNDESIIKKKKKQGRNSVIVFNKNKSISIESSNKKLNNKRKKKSLHIKFSQKNKINIFNFASNDKKKEKSERNIFSFFKGNNFSDFELNELGYLEAIKYDKRTFLIYYWSLIRREHLIVFTFFAYNDYNILSLKLSKFVFAVATDFALNVMFFFDDSMRKIYLDYGKYNFIALIPQAIYSTILSETLDILLRYLCLTEKDMYKIKKIEKKKKKKVLNKNLFKILRCIKMRIISYLIFTHLLFFFYWYFVATFCAVYKNTQIILIKDSFLSLFLSLLYPFILYLLPTTLRIISLRDSKKRLKCLYKSSDVIPLI